MERWVSAKRLIELALLLGLVIGACWLVSNISGVVQDPASSVNGALKGDGAKKNHNGR